MKCDVCIVGAGPGGLTCAALLAQSGRHVVVLERHDVAGKKVCAGGITWNGLLDKVPASLIERSFPVQIIQTPRRRVSVRAPHPLIGTVNRQRFGTYLAKQAEAQGATVHLSARVREITGDQVFFQDGNVSRSITCSNLVGADGSHSRVRSYLGLPTSHLGIGITYMLSIPSADMVWNFDARRFGCGYSWLFPHRELVSAGVYSGTDRIPAALLKRRLDDWLREQQIPVNGAALKADLVNHDFRGWSFSNRYLVGDAAGLASPLTGEGIYPAVMSGRAVAKAIIGDGDGVRIMARLAKQHRRHRRMLRWADKSPVIASLLAETAALLLHYRVLSWETFEMA